MPPSSAKPLPRIAGYKFIEFLGEGSYGDVYKVKKDNQTYALKILKSNARSEGVERFGNEIWALQQLDNPHFPKLLQEGYFRSQQYFVMTLFEGSSLRQKLAKFDEWGHRPGEKWTLYLINSLANLLLEMQARNIFHRDVKDDNIICDNELSDVNLIDFGFCRGEAQPFDIASFRNVGQPWFSPPNKIKHPASNHPSHDVFALGVLAYYVLTRTMPWPREGVKDAGVLEDLLRSVTPVRADSRDPRISGGTAALIADILVPDDGSRPRPLEVIERTKVLIDSDNSSRSSIPMVISERPQVSRVIRDPIHGDVWLTKIEDNIIKSDQFQRLRRIRQLGFANLVYPGAEHTRFSHSLGVLFVANKIANTIDELSGHHISVEERQILRIYALIHDIAHVCFGHTLEDELGFYKRHDENEQRAKRMLDPAATQLGQLLHQSEIGRAVTASIIDPDETHSLVPTFIKEIVSSAFGADVIDYINRDSLFCGLDHRVDSAVFRNFRIVSLPTGRQREEHLVSRHVGSRRFRLDREFASESILLERFALFLKVYMHLDKIAAGAMLGKAISSINISDKKLLDEKISSFGDDDLLQFLGNTNSEAAKIIPMIRNGVFYTAVFGGRIITEPRLSSYEDNKHYVDKFVSPEDREKAEDEIAKMAEVSSSKIIMYCTKNPPGFQKIEQYVQGIQGTSVRDERHKPHVRIRERHLTLWWIYVFVEPSMSIEHQNLVAIAAATYLRRDNEISMDRRQGMLL